MKAEIEPMNTGVIKPLITVIREEEVFGSEFESATSSNPGATFLQI